MKTTLFGLVCVLIGSLAATYLPGTGALMGLVVGVLIVIFVNLAGSVIEALTINRRLWGEDRYERE